MAQTFVVSNGIEDSSKYKLFEVSEDIISALEHGGRVSIRGKPGDEAVLCTNKETYSMRLAVSSNTLLLLPPDGSDHKSAVASLTCYYELAKTVPRLQVVSEILAKSAYEGEDNEDTKATSLLTLDDISNIVQASDQELRQGLKECNAFEHNGFWRIFKPAFAVEVVDLLLTNSTINEWKLDLLDEKDVITAMPEYNPQILVHTLAMYGIKVNGTWKMDLSKLSKFRAVQLLMLGENGKDWRLSDFITAWKDSAPPDAPADMEMLQGVAVVVTQGKESMVRYLSAADLCLKASDPKERLRQLFGIQPRWSLTDLLPYLADLAPNQAGIQNILIKYARTITTSSGTLYCSRDVM